MFLSALVFTTSSQRAFSVTLDNKTWMGYSTDVEKNRIPNFSYAGYKNGNFTTPPRFPIQIILIPINGDATNYIQQAINTVGQMPLINGIRGAILLNPGIYNISGTLQLIYNGVSLLGSGDGFDPAYNTILQGTGTSSQYAIVKIGANKINWYANSLKIMVTNDLLPIGARKVNITSVAGFNVGDKVVLTYPANDAWLASVNYGGTYTAPPWSAGFTSIAYLRKIISIDAQSNTILLDAPIFDKMVRAISSAYISPFDGSGITTNVIVSNLNIKILGISATDENHAPTNILIDGTEDVWIHQCTVSGFVRSGIAIYTSTQLTVSSSLSINPMGQSIENNFYNFAAERGAQLVLFINNYASGGRHQYVINGMTLSSGVVFYNNTSFYPSSVDEAHRQWSTGILYDNHNTIAPGNYATVGLYNRGSFGTSHGWSCAHCVLWHSNFQYQNGAVAGGAMIQKPPNAQNYGIANSLSIQSGTKPPCPFPGTTGFTETIHDPSIKSLYITQLQVRFQ